MSRDACLRVRCLLPGRLIDRATARGARFSSVRLVGDRDARFECDDASARILSELCERFSVPCVVTRPGAASALARFARRRRTLPVGLILTAALCWLFLGRFWIIDVAFSGGTASLGDRAALYGALSRAGIRPGVSRRVDTALLAQSLMSGDGGYSYVGAHRQGVRLLVEAVPEVPVPEVYDVDAPRDLVADRDGVVLSAVVRSGELCVSPGDVVRRGQLLIRGEERASGDGTRPIAALGEVVVRAWIAGEARLPLHEARTELTGRQSVGLALSAPWRSWQLVGGDSYSSQAVETRRLPIGGLFLPLELEETTRRETRTSTEAVEPGVLRARLSALALADAALALGREGPADGEIAGSWTEYEIQGDAMLARAVYEIHIDAAVPRRGLQGG